MGLGHQQSKILMGCLGSVWESGKSCCGQKRFYAAVGGTVALLLVAVVLGIAVLLHL